MNHVLIILSVISSVLCCKNHNWNPLIRRHIAALILARGGSKGIPLKNLAKIGTRSLLNITLTEVAKVDFSSVWVSTDHELILKEAGGVNVHWRSEKSATDDAPSIWGIQDFLRVHPEVDIVGLVQCTSPFVKSWYLQQGLAKVVQGVDCVFSVTRSYKLRWKEENGEVHPVNFDIQNRPRRQDWSGEFVENGMFYFIDRATAMNKGILQNSRYTFYTYLQQNNFPGGHKLVQETFHIPPDINTLALIKKKKS